MLNVACMQRCSSVLLLLLLLAGLQSFLSDLDHYIRHQDPGGSVAFAWALNALLYCTAGDAPRCAEYLRRSYEGFVFGPFNVWMEGRGG